MTTALAERPAEAVTITNDQTALIKQTIAVGATDAELKLFFYDCTRRGVHPLDKLIHFTKRGGKYTPITSIDFMRARAHETGECAGIDDPHFTGEPKKDGFAARVVVKRIVQGHLCDFAATARWEEYCPAQGQNHMWLKMPHTMLGKCAEALALRKAFPQQLQGLYAHEEMDQAGTDVPPQTRQPEPSVNPETGEIVEAQSHGDGLYVTEVRKAKTGTSRRGPWTLWVIGFSDDTSLKTFKDEYANEADAAREGDLPVRVEADGSDLKSISIIRPAGVVSEQPHEPVTEPLDDSDIPF